MTLKSLYDLKVTFVNIKLLKFHSFLKILEKSDQNKCQKTAPSTNLFYSVGERCYFYSTSLRNTKTKGSYYVRSEP